MMHDSPSQKPPDAGTKSNERGERYIYIACPWTPVGGGMFKVADYLIQSQAAQLPPDAARLRPLDTRGADRAVFSLWYLTIAIGKILAGWIGGGLAGVHLNVAERMSLFRKGSLILVCAAVRVPTVLHLHAQMHRFYDTLPSLLQRLTRWVFSLPEAVIVIGPGTRNFVVDTLKVPADRVRTIINGVPEGRLITARTRPAEPLRALFLGNLSHRKGLPDLLRALTEPALDGFPVELVVAGGGDVARYMAEARALGVEGSVRFEGWCDQPTVHGLLEGCDLMVLPSYDEVLPLSILEALAHGVPVVTTAVGEIPSLLTDGQDALFVQPGDAAGIAAAIRKIVENPALRDAMGANGRALYLLHFSLQGFFCSVANVHRNHFGVAGKLGSAPGSAESA
jgi:glycosyltransferase involved in cell wall biosynthesis